jgi:hypothetical protein
MSEYNLTPQEAIGVIDKNWPQSNYSMLREALKMAKEAIEKQIPSKVQNIKTTPNNTFASCPSCGLSVIKVNYCQRCGQKFDWGEL